MQYWLAWFHEGIEQAAEVARAAERLGFQGIAVPDHVAIPEGYGSVHPSGRRIIEPHTSCPDLMITLAAMAAATSTIELMTYVYVLTMRDPFSAAKQAATLATLSEHRFGFGVGAGWCFEEIALLGHDPSTRGRRMDEMLDIMRDLWTRGEAECHGRHFDFGPVGQHPVPERRVPVWIGGRSERALARAARHDGWAGMSYPMGEIETLLGRLEIERRKHVDRFGEGDLPFRRFVMPETLPSRDVYARLEDWGIDGAVAMAWPVGDPSFAPREAKLDAMEHFAEQFIAP